MTNGVKGDSLKDKGLTKAQLGFLEYCQGFGYGKLEVDVKDGQPVGAWVVVKGNVVQHYEKFD